MATVPVYNIRGEVDGELELPSVFGVPIRPELIRRVSEALATHSLQPKGVDMLAGMKTSAESYGVGRGLARMARVGGERNPRAGQAAGVASVRKGRATHPPRVDKVLYKRVNTKERRLATASAIAATAVRDMIVGRGHRVSQDLTLPVVADDELESLGKASEVLSFLRGLKLDSEIERLIQGRKRRTGISRRRGRVSRTPTGPLIITERDEGIRRAARNIPGVTHVLARNLSVLHLAPGGRAGRLTIFTQSALTSLPETLNQVASRVLALRVGGG